MMWHTIRAWLCNNLRNNSAAQSPALQGCLDENGTISLLLLSASFFAKLMTALHWRTLKA